MKFMNLDIPSFFLLKKIKYIMFEKDVRLKRMLKVIFTS